MKNMFRVLMSYVLATLLLAGPAVAQTPRVLDGDTVTRYSGYRNFIANPSAQFNAASVTLSNATAVRSTTTPLGEGGTEWNVAITSANGTVDFLTAGATTANLGGATCEATADVRGFQATSRVQVFDGTNILYTDTFGAKANREKVGFIGFPCPADPSTLRLRITDTAILAGTNEVAGAYIGRSRNIGDAANITTWTSYTPTLSGFGSKGVDVNIARWRRVGDTMEARGIISTNVTASGAAATDVSVSLPSGLTTDTAKVGSGQNLGWAMTYGVIAATQFDRQTEIYPDGSSAIKFLKPTTSGFITQNDLNNTNEQEFHWFVNIPISNWPIASSAVSPSAQNVYGVRKWDGNQTTVTRNTNAYTAWSGATLASNVTNTGVATACASANDLCVKIPSLPPGEYVATVSASFLADVGTSCAVGLSTTNSSAGLFATTEIAGDAATNLGYGTSLHGYFTVSAQADTEVYVLGNRISGSICTVSGGSSSRRITLSVAPANRSPSAFYVQSPVRDALSGTQPLVNEVGYRVTASRTSAFTQSTPTLATWYDVPTLTHTLDPGVWDLETQCSVCADWTSGIGYGMPAISIRTGSTVLAGAINGFVGDPANAIKPPSFWCSKARAKVRVGITSSTTYKTSISVQGFSGSPAYGSVVARGDLAGGTECYIDAVRAHSR